MSLSLVIGPTAEPVSLAEAKRQMRVEGTDEDAHITGLITAARAWAEEYTGRQLMPATWRLTLDRFPKAIRLPKAPLTSVSSIKYTDSAGAEQTWTSSEYQVDAASEPARIVPAYGEIYPTVRSELATVRVEYIAGYADADTVPQPIKHGILLLVAELFERREHAIVGAVINNVPMGVEALLGPYRIVEFV